MTTRYEPTMTLREARKRYFEDNQFGPDGGYGDAWVDFKLGPLPMPFPNTASRIEAVRYHDLHHLLTGYATDTRGEFEISAWELGAGCGSFAAAWVLNLGGLAAGVVSCPRRTWRAFARGLASRSLYGEDLEKLLDRTVGEVRAERLPAGEAPGGLLRGAWFAATAAAGFVVGGALMMLVVPLVPVGLLAGRMRRATA